ncbi:MAG: STAS domain-containing protein [Chitinispirillaceae bacterium]|nr:STAS domain-containing protein [Chitinispirillaceae bacterium]
MSGNSIKIAGDTITIVTDERLDANNAPLLLEELKGNVGKTFNRVVFDCRKLIYVSSAGLRPFIFSKQKLVPDGEVLVLGAPEPVVRVIKLSGFDSFLAISDEV